MLDNEIKYAQEGKDAWAIIKINSLVDKKMVQKVYEASQAGVKIKMIIRGICTLIPGIKGISDNVDVISIVDRFLEHSRVFIFCNGNDNQYYIGSADWMPRNLDHRIEVLTPVFDSDIRQELWDIIQIQLADNTKARESGETFINKYKNSNSEEKVRSQFKTYEYFKQKLEKIK